MKTLSPRDVADKMKSGKIALVDIREHDEHVRENIEGAQHIPLSAIKAGTAILPANTDIVFHCKSGNRTTVNADELRACLNNDIAVLDGGLDGWKNAGLSTKTNLRAPMELNRQVQIIAGGCVVTGVLLGILIHPAFLAVAGVVGAGLMYAGISGTCGMAKLLSLAPWNVYRISHKQTT